MLAKNIRMGITDIQPHGLFPQPILQVCYKKSFLLINLQTQQTPNPLAQVPEAVPPLVVHSEL